MTLRCRSQASRRTKFGGSALGLTKNGNAGQCCVEHHHSTLNGLRPGIGVCHCCRFDLGDNSPQVTGVKVYQAAAAGADEVLLELDFGWTSDAEISLIVHPMPHQAWLATPVVEVLSKLIVVKVGCRLTDPSSAPVVKIDCLTQTHRPLIEAWLVRSVLG